MTADDHVKKANALERAKDAANAAWNDGYRSGVRVVKEWIHNETCPIGRWGEGKALLFQRKFDEFIYQLLAEQEGK